jgi:hypothetical protein
VFFVLLKRGFVYFEVWQQKRPNLNKKSFFLGACEATFLHFPGDFDWQSFTPLIRMTVVEQKVQIR